MVDPAAADKFHAHLDVCQQCEKHPFNQCVVGHRLLMAITGDQPEDSTSSTTRHKKPKRNKPKKQRRNKKRRR